MNNPLAPEVISPPRRRIYLMRHGSVTYFAADGKKVDGRTVTLNEAGRTQATAAGIALAHAGAHFDRVIVSGLPRTVETAERVLAETRQHITIESWPDFEELKAGPIAEIPDEALRDAFVGAFSGVVAEEKRYAGGESIGELLDRVYGALDRLLADRTWDTVLLVLHGGVNRAILSRALTGQRMFLGNLSQAPACINALDVGMLAGDWVVRYTGLAPTDLLQPEQRSTTLEAMLLEYVRVRELNASLSS